MSKNSLPLSPPLKPAICRMVIFHSTFPEERWNGATQHAAVITGVKSDDVVNLLVHPNGAQSVVQLNIPREGSFKPVAGFPHRCWVWPPRN